MPLIRREPGVGNGVGEVTTLAFAAVAVLLLLWSLTSGLLARRNVTGPLVFVVAGYLLANPGWGVASLDLEAEVVHGLAEYALALVLFADASRVNMNRLRRDVGVPARLLGIGLPLTLGVGALAAALFFDDIPWSLALFLGAALAPTDAALSAQVVGDKRVPAKLRLSLNVESGLNDGIVTPVVGLALALTAATMGTASGAESQQAAWIGALIELAIGIGAGAALGAAGALGVNLAGARGWALPGGRRLATLATALAAFALAVGLDGNGFLAAFVAGVVFGRLLDQRHLDDEAAIVLPELGGELLALVVWFVFGAQLVPLAFAHLTAADIGFALLSLTLFRLVPVLVALLGSGLALRDQLFVGWFGPRGLASVVFAVLAAEELGESGTTGHVIAIVAWTVLFSVVAHGVTAGPAARAYGAPSSSGDGAAIGRLPRRYASR